MIRRPSRVVVALARWALMAGLAGVVLALLAFIDHFRAPENFDSRRNLLRIAAILLSLAFVLAPVVRRAFAVALAAPPELQARKTLLDEMRGRPEGESPADSPALDAPAAPRRSVATKLIVVLYVAFGMALITVLLAAQ